MRTRLRRTAVFSYVVLTLLSAGAASGQVTEIIDSSGDGAGNPLNAASGVAVDSAGNLFVSGAHSDNVLMATPTGQVMEIIDATGDGAGNPLDNARGVAVADDGTVFVSAWSGNNVFMIVHPGQANQVITEILDASGGGVDPIGRPSRMIVGPNGDLFVCGLDTDNVLMIENPGAPGQAVTHVIGPSGDGVGNALDLPDACAFDGAGALYVSGGLSDNVFKVTSPGTPAQTITQVIDATGDGAGNPLDLPRDVVVDGAGTLFVGGLDSDNVFRVTEPGLPGQTITQILDASGAGPGSTLDGANYLAVDSVGTLYVTGVLSDNAFQIVGPGVTNVVSEIIDASGDGQGNTLDVTATVAVDDAGHVFVAGYGSDNVLRIDVTPPSFVVFGFGCPGTGGVVPTLVMSGNATPGGAVQLEVLKGVGGGSAFVFFGLDQAAIPMAFGCTLNVTPLLPPILGAIPLFPIGAQGPGAGSIVIPGTLPTTITPPVSITLQAFVSDAGAAGGFANTNGIEMTIE